MTRTQFIEAFGDKTCSELNESYNLYVIQKIMVSTILKDDAILFKIKSYVLNWLTVEQALSGTE